VRPPGDRHGHEFYAARRSQPADAALGALPAEPGGQLPRQRVSFEPEPQRAAPAGGVRGHRDRNGDPAGCGPDTAPHLHRPRPLHTVSADRTPTVPPSDLFPHSPPPPPSLLAPLQALLSESPPPLPAASCWPAGLAPPRARIRSGAP